MKFFRTPPLPPWVRTLGPDADFPFKMFFPPFSSNRMSPQKFLRWTSLFFFPPPRKAMLPTFHSACLPACRFGFPHYRGSLSLPIYSKGSFFRNLPISASFFYSRVVLTVKQDFGWRTSLQDLPSLSSLMYSGPAPPSFSAHV